MSQAIEQIVEGYYRELEKCLARQWSDIIRKFPPNAIRSAIREIVETYINMYRDPAEFDWCTHFSYITDFDDVHSFISYLISKGYIPSDFKGIEQYISLLEKQASEIGYRLVKEEEYYKMTRDINRLRRELDKLREERKKLEEEINRLTKMVEEMQRARAVAEAPKRIEIRRRRLSDVMDYNTFLQAVASTLNRYGIPNALLNRLMPLLESDLTTFYRSSYENDIGDISARIFNWISNEYLKARCIFSSAIHVNIVVRPTRPIWIGGFMRSPKISYIEPRFELWIKDLELQGFKVVRDLVPVSKAMTNLVHDPDTASENVFIYVCDNAIATVSCDAIAYLVDEINRVVYYQRYYPYRLR